MTTVKKVKNLPVGFIAISLGLNWLLMLYFGTKLRRFKIWLYPLMFILSPFFNWYYMVYGIFTAGQRTWGGPRADAAAADTHTTAREAAEQAEKQGDELNIVPETFKPALEARRAASKADAGRRSEVRRTKSIIRPPDKIDGKFSARRKTAAGIYAHPDELAANLDMEAGVPHAQAAHPGRWETESRDSIDSVVSDAVCMPRRVESFMGEEDRRKYEIAQQVQMNRSRSKDLVRMKPARRLELHHIPPRRHMIKGHGRVKAQGSTNTETSGQSAQGSSMERGPQSVTKARLWRKPSETSFASRMARNVLANTQQIDDKKQPEEKTDSEK